MYTYKEHKNKGKEAKQLCNGFYEWQNINYVMCQVRGCQYDMHIPIW